MISSPTPENQGRPAGDVSAPPAPQKAAPKPSSTPAPFSRVSHILEKHGRKPSRLVPILQEVQEEYRYLPSEVLSFVARSLNVAPARVFGVATFYAHFAIKPKGRHLVRLCDGTACHVKDSVPILDAIRAKLGVDAKQPTSRDLLFTVETVACLGACGLAPVVVIDDQVHGAMTPEKACAALDAVIAKEKEVAS
ncbi:MAG TPA: NAD(P)H-dependent oxidoreductase subunit E [Opitutaceae bacterium]|nr:NAD(P)H-dependent oxidoreductase subunit E [Opitutaceae bacterium]